MAELRGDDPGRPLQPQPRRPAAERRPGGDHDLQRDELRSNLLACYRALREAAASYEGNWRDIVLFLCAVLFTVIWSQKEPHGSNYWPLLIALIIACVVTAFYAFRGLRRALAQMFRRRSN